MSKRRISVNAPVASKILGVSEATLRALTVAGQIPYVRQSGLVKIHYYYSLSDLRAWRGNGETTDMGKSCPEPETVRQAVLFADEFSSENLSALNAWRPEKQEQIEKERPRIQARKPQANEWFMIHPEHKQCGWIIENKDRSNAYWVSQKVKHLAEEHPRFFFCHCVLAVSENGKTFIWPVRDHVPTGRADDKFTGVPMEAMRRAKNSWTRIYWQHEKRTHEIENADIDEPPVFPDQPFADLLKQAFSETMIDSPDHPVFRRQNR